MKKLALLGASGHGKVVAEMAMRQGWREITFFDDAWPEKNMNGLWPVEGGTNDLLSRLADYDGVVVSIGHCETRWQKHLLLQGADAPIVSIIHPSAVISPNARLGAGTVVMAGAVVNIDSVLGQSVIINTGATIDHDCKVSDAVHIGPGASISGNVSLGFASWIGVGACVRQGQQIGDQVMVGAGAVVVSDLPDGVVVKGNPAKPSDLFGLPREC